MATYDIASDEVGVYEKTLTANTVDTVQFAMDLSSVEIVKDEGAAIYLTVDGSKDPTVGGQHCWHLPAGVRAVRVVASTKNQHMVVKLISPGTTTYSVAKVSD